MKFKCCFKNLYKNRSLKNRDSGENSSEERSVKTETLDEGEDWEKVTAESEKKSNSSKKGDADKSLEKDDETEVTEGDGETVKKTPTKKVKKEKNGSGDEVGTDKEEGVVSGDEIEADDKDATKEKGETIPKSRFTGKTFIKLTCIQCEIKCLTFKVTNFDFFLFSIKNQTNFKLIYRSTVTIYMDEHIKLQ